MAYKKVSHYQGVTQEKSHESKELSQDLCNLIVANHTDGIGYRRISKLLNIPVSTVWAMSRKWKEHDFTINWPRSGAPRKISDRGVKRIIGRVVQEPRTTVESFRNTWNLQVQLFRRKQCTQPPWPVCTLTTYASIRGEKAC